MEKEEKKKEFFTHIHLKECLKMKIVDSFMKK